MSLPIFVKTRWKILVGAYIGAIILPAAIVSIGVSNESSFEKLLTFIVCAGWSLLFPLLAFRKHIKGIHFTTIDARGLGIAIGCNIWLLIQAWNFYAGMFEKA
jgi:hypothetical protein